MTDKERASDPQSPGARLRERREGLVERLERYPVRTCRSLHSCVLCGKEITLGERYHDGGYGRRAHEDCISGKCPRCGAEAHGSGDEEAGISMAWCSKNCGWEVVV